MLRQGANHELWVFNGQRLTIPRHNEINELTARGSSVKPSRHSTDPKARRTRQETNKENTMATYTVTARRTGDWWALEVPDVPGAYTQCKRLDQAADMAREAIVLILDNDEADIDVEIQPQLPPKMDKLVLSFRRAREAQEEAVRQAQQEQSEALHDLVVECHLSYRDVGRIVGLSHQRVSQVLKAKVDA